MEDIMSCCERKALQSDRAPKAIGPYSIGVVAGHFLFTSGQIGIDPATGNIVEGGIEAETRQVFANLRAVLQAGGADLKDIVKTTVFLRDIADFARMNAIYAEYFTENPPARSAFQVAALPKGAAVEIEAVAILPDTDEKCCCG
jgi:2-iminobutanoate/2-iminopropanoate deaminase